MKRIALRPVDLRADRLSRETALVLAVTLWAMALSIIF